MVFLKNIFARVQKLPPAAKASFWFVVSSVVLRGISFITTPIFTRLLNVTDYGKTSVFVTWEGIISIFATLSLSGGVYNVAMTKYEDDIDSFTSSMLGLTALSTTFVYCVCVLLNIFAPNVFELNNAFLLFMWLQTLMTAATSFWIMRKRFVYDYKKVISFTFLNALLCPIIAIVAIFLFPNHKAYAKIVGAGLPGIIIGCYLGIRAVFRGKKLFHKNYWKYALGFNVPLLPHYLATVVFNSGDKLMLNSMLGAAEVGLYSIAHSITGLISLFTHAINHSLIPFTLQCIKKKQTQNLYRYFFVCSLIVSSICVGVLFFAREGILIFATPAYLNAVFFVAPLTFAVQMSFISGLLGNILFYYEKTGLMSLMTMICGGINIIANYFGIQHWGYVAVGYTTLLCCLIRLALYYLCVRKYEKNLPEILNIKLLILVLATFSFFVFVAVMLKDNLLARVGVILVLFLVIALNSKKLIMFFRNMRDERKPAPKCQ